MSHLDPTTTDALKTTALVVGTWHLQDVVQVDYARRLEVALRRIASNNGRASAHPSECDELRQIAADAVRAA